MVFPRLKNLKKKNNKQNVLHGQLCQLTEHKLWSFRGFRQKYQTVNRKNSRSMQKHMISSSSKSSNIRLLQWRTEVFGHKG